MKRIVISLIAACMALGSLTAQSKVAVLDAIVPNTIDQSVVIPVTEKLMECLVVSGKFTVLDRANIEQILKEQEFQVSGMVSDADITAAGKYLGADYVVVSRVQQIGDTYFLSAKMILVRTGVITNQASTESEGKLSVLISMADEVGTALSGGSVPAAAAAERDSERKTLPAAKTAPAAKTTPAAEPVPASAEQTRAAKIQAKQQAAADRAQRWRVGERLYFGLGGGTTDYTNPAGDDEGQASCSGIELYTITNIAKVFSLAGNITWLDSSSSGGNSLLSLEIGPALTIPIGIFMPYLALKIGTTITDSENYPIGLNMGIDLGFDFRFGNFLVGTRYEYQYIKLDYYENSNYYYILDQNSIWLMLGWRF